MCRTSPGKQSRNVSDLVQAVVRLRTVRKRSGPTSAANRYGTLTSPQCIGIGWLYLVLPHRYMRIVVENITFDGDAVL